METWTIQKLLNWTTTYFTEKSVDSPRLAAEMLLSHILDLKRIELYTKFDTVVADEKRKQLRELVKRAGQNEPIQYLIGKTEFYSLQLDISPACLIPRPETELLAEKAIDFLRSRNGHQLVCDLCTGSGCIAVAIAKNCPNTKIIATDISSEALAVAARNVQKHQVKNRVTLLCGDLFDPIIPPIDTEKFDLVTCNPPYISTAEFESLDKNIKDYEPYGALLAGPDGLDVYKRVIEKAPDFLKPDSALMLEIGYAHGPAVKKLLQNHQTFSQIRIEKDFHDNDRIATAKKTG